MKGAPPTKSQLFVVLAIFISMATMIILTLKEKSANGLVDLSFLWIGIVASIICGISISFVTILSKNLNMSGISATQIMMYRFILLIGFCGFLASGETIFFTLKEFFLPLLFIALIGNVIPLFTLQLSIEKLEPIMVTLLLVLAPIFYLIIQLFDKSIPISPISWIAISITVILVAIGTLINSKVSTKSRSQTPALAPSPKKSKNYI
ncbi:hypothetical protein [Psychrobacter aquimaris]|uniref:hypothetical protein n=1 Tax=Psychrobacter aquimaris TaxID=292733 RepID=UPI003FD45F37